MQSLCCLAEFANNMIKTHNITFAYKDISFSFPDIECEAGEVLLVIGKSGSGKTTFLHLLGGLLKPLTGTIAIGKTEINNLTNRQLDHFRGKNIGIVFQQAHYMASLSVLDNLLLAASANSKILEKERSINLLSQFGMENLLYQKPENLSLGQQQRLSIARALVNAPILLLADEPTSSLDDDNCYNVVNVLYEQAKRNNSALIIVTHDHRLKEIFPQKIEL